MKKLIGLTGWPGSGKTAAAAFFRKKGARVIDADSLVHGLYAGSPAVRRKIIAQFGKGVKTARGGINRKKLAEAAFKNKASLFKLCRIVHPEVIRRIKSQAAKAKKGIIIIDAPLLLEAGLAKAVDSVITVRAGRKKCVERSRKRGFMPADTKRRLSLQAPMREKCAEADFVINNNGGKKDLEKKVAIIWRKLKPASRQAGRKENGKG